MRWPGLESAFWRSEFPRVSRCRFSKTQRVFGFRVFHTPPGSVADYLWRVRCAGRAFGCTATVSTKRGRWIAVKTSKFYMGVLKEPLVGLHEERSSFICCLQDSIGRTRKVIAALDVVAVVWAVAGGEGLGYSAAHGGTLTTRRQPTGKNEPTPDERLPPRETRAKLRGTTARNPELHRQRNALIIKPSDATLKTLPTNADQEMPTPSGPTDLKMLSHTFFLERAFSGR